VCRHQEETIVWSRIGECRRLNGIVERRRAAEYTKGLILDGGQNLRMDRHAALPRQVKRQHRQNIVVAGNAGTLGDKIRRRALKHRESSLDGFADLGFTLRKQRLRNQRGEQNLTH
jgi:hypothetical protein